MTEKDKDKNRMKPKNLTEQIVYSEVFIVMGNKAHLFALRYSRSEASIQTKLARKFNKPVIIVLMNELSETDKADLERFFIGYNVIKTIDLDLNDAASCNAVQIEIIRLSGEIMRNRVLTRSDFIRIDLDKEHYYYSFKSGDRVEICFEVCAGGFCVAAYNEDQMMLEPRKCTNCDGYLESVYAMFGERKDDAWIKALEIANDLYKRFIVDKIDSEGVEATYMT